MEESVKCECGNTQFWYFWDRVRCPHCHNEYKLTNFVLNFGGNVNQVTYSGEKWVRRFNNETHEYSNWENVQ